MTRDDVRRYLVAYDVPNDRRRSRVAKELESYGDRVQFSVFVLDISPASLLRLQVDLLELMETEEDSVLVCDLGLKTSVSEKNFQYLGVQRQITDDSYIIV